MDGVGHRKRISTMQMEVDYWERYGALPHSRHTVEGAIKM